MDLSWKHIDNLRSVETVSSQAEFLNKFYQSMFTSYIKKTILETRKQYFIREKKRQENILDANYEEIDNIFFSEPADAEMEVSLTAVITDPALFHSVQKLTARQKTVIHQFYLEEKSDVEIAKEFKISRQAVHKIRKQALSNIKKNYRNK